MKRRSHDPGASPLADSTIGALIEKWIVPNVEPAPDKRYIPAQLLFNDRMQLCVGSTCIIAVCSWICTWTVLSSVRS